MAESRGLTQDLKELKGIAYAALFVSLLALFLLLGFALKSLGI